MTVAFDAVGPSASGAASATSPLTWSHTCGASATHLVVGVNVDQAAGSAPTCTATYNSVSMTACSPASGNIGTSGYLFLFYMASPPTGSALTVSATVSGGATRDAIVGGSISFTGSSTISGATYNTGTSITTSVTVSSTTSGNLIAAVGAVGDNIVSTGSPATQRWLNNFKQANGDDTGNATGATNASTGSSVTTSWTNTSAADTWVAGAVEVQASAGAPAFYPFRPVNIVPIRRASLW